MSFKEFSYAHSVPAKDKYDHLKDASTVDEPSTQPKTTLAEERLQRSRMARMPVNRRWKEEGSN